MCAKITESPDRFGSRHLAWLPRNIVGGPTRKSASASSILSSSAMVSLHFTVFVVDND